MRKALFKNTYLILRVNEKSRIGNALDSNLIGKQFPKLIAMQDCC